ncbi:MAG TPA: rhomboid family intramembrane serine protease [Candidatus Eremiobacteraceae bacterium]|nr:rhomboid family intramembrane serine protease [Candidatus Eremiobacteraceae bacterium]
MSWRTAPVTLTMLGLCWVAFLYDLAVTGGDQPAGPLVSLGQIVPVLIQQGQWWRLITSGFIHYGILHIAFNSYALFQVGLLVEYVYGSARYFAIYMVALVAGGFAAYYSTIGTNDATAGASGAIMGVFGAMAVLGFKLPHARSVLLRSALMPIVLTLGNGFVNSGISNAGHIGGLIGGVAVAWILTPARLKELAPQDPTPQFGPPDG